MHEATMNYDNQVINACAEKAHQGEVEKEWEESQVEFLTAKGGKYYPLNPVNFWEAITEQDRTKCRVLADLLEAGSFEDAGKMLKELSRQYWTDFARTTVKGTYEPEDDEDPEAYDRKRDRELEEQF